MVEMRTRGQTSSGVIEKDSKEGLTAGLRRRVWVRVVLVACAVLALITGVAVYVVVPTHAGTIVTSSE